jgi:hypothetical protein
MLTSFCLKKDVLQLLIEILKGGKEEVEEHICLARGWQLLQPSWVIWQM